MKFLYRDRQDGQFRKNMVPKLRIQRSNANDNQARDCCSVSSNALPGFEELHLLIYNQYKEENSWFWWVIALNAF